MPKLNRSAIERQLKSAIDAAASIVSLRALGGLTEDETAILYPNDLIADGISVRGK